MVLVDIMDKITKVVDFLFSLKGAYYCMCILQPQIENGTVTISEIRDEPIWVSIFLTIYVCRNDIVFGVALYHKIVLVFFWRKV